MIRFSSNATGDVQMLRAHAEILLAAIGKELGERGVITPAEMPAAIAALESAGQRDRHERQALEAEEQDDSDDEDVKSNQIGLSQRAFPLVQMMKHAQAEDASIVWGI